MIATTTRSSINVKPDRCNIDGWEEGRVFTALCAIGVGTIIGERIPAGSDGCCGAGWWCAVGRLGWRRRRRTGLSTPRPRDPECLLGPRPRWRSTANASRSAASTDNPTRPSARWSGCDPAPSSQGTAHPPPRVGPQSLEAPSRSLRCAPIPARPGAGLLTRQRCPAARRVRSALAVQMGTQRSAIPTSRGAPAPGSQGTAHPPQYPREPGDVTGSRDPRG